MKEKETLKTNAEETPVPSPETVPSPEADASAPAPESPADSPAELSAEEQIAEFRDMALRARAEMDNFRKRVTREKEDAIRYANMSLLEKLLPLIDNFDLGLDAAKQAGEAAAPVVEGFSMVRRQFDDFLRDQNVEVINAEGATFDHNIHEAVGSEPHTEVPEGTVIRQIRRGYSLKDRLLRPAAVIVSKGPSSPDGQ
jgi:molecular chaperone GrpE